MARDNCCNNLGALPQPAVAGPAIVVHDVCEMADMVKVCGTSDEPFELTGADCEGAPVVTTVDPGQGGYAVQPEGHVYTVKLCNPAQLQDREMAILCTPAGSKVVVQNVTPIDAPLGTPPVFEAWTFAGTPWVGDKSTLVDCGAEKIDIAPATFFCAAGQEVTRTSVWDITSTPATLVGSIWQDIHGAVITAPAASTLFAGQCQAAVYTERAICANTSVGEVWNMVERTSTDAAGAVIVSYWDPDTSPMTDVTALFYAIRHGGACECCSDVVPPKVAELSLTKTTPTPQAFAGDAVTFILTATNNGPDSADGATITDQIPAGMTVTSVTSTTSGGAAGVTGTLPTLTIATFPAGGSVQVTVSGVATGGNIVNNATVSLAGNSVDNPTANNTGSATIQGCAWQEYHELLVPISTIMGVYTTGSGVNNLGFVDFATGAITNVGNIPGTNLNALGLDKSSNNAVFLDRISGRIYTAYSPYYVISNPSTLQAGSVAAANAILGALDSAQQWWVGGITNSDGSTATISVAVVDPQTGVQTAVPSLTATLTTGSSGFDFDFAPNDDLYVLTGLNFYVSTKASNYAGWQAVGTLTGIAGTGGSVAYDQGVLRGTSSTGQIWAFDITTGVTTVTSNMPAGTTMADMSGAVDPICKRFFLNSCDGKFYELNKVVEYEPYGTPVLGGC
jgi:uncharacterized repeat protein (TIGR01451 family)